MILIRTMEMPKSCSACSLCVVDEDMETAFCAVKSQLFWPDSRNVPKDKRHESCPLEEVWPKNDGKRNIWK